jgi:glc operon protein GlcG
MTERIAPFRPWFMTAYIVFVILWFSGDGVLTNKDVIVRLVVVDDGGYPLVLHRLDDTQVASVEVGIGKACTAAIFRRPSRDFEEQIKDGRLASLVLPGATPLQGGLPIVLDGKVIGAIGVSGNTPQEDEDIARAGAAAFP